MNLPPLPPVLLDHPEVRAALDDLRTAIAATLGERLLGLYLYGSAIWGDFDARFSDLDMTAVVVEPIVETDLPALGQMHAAFVASHPVWHDRIEVQYITPEALRTFRERESSMANISPGEPLHLIPANIDWLTNWYFIQDYGATLLGPSPDTYIPAISDDEFLQAIRDHAAGWPEYVQHTRDHVGGQGYAVLTMCRALYTTRTGKQVSKQKAAAWAMNEYPEDADLIRSALEWRSGIFAPEDVPALTYPLVENYVKRCVARIAISDYTEAESSFPSS